MFLDNKYTSWHWKIINKSQNRQLSVDAYVEKHHIIPKSLGGSDNKENMAKLTAREHFICHLLLTRMLTGSSKMRMCFAIWRMCHGHKYSYKPNSKLYEIIKNIYSIEISNSLKGVPKSKEHKEKIRASNLGKTRSKETRNKISNAQKHRPEPSLITRKKMVRCIVRF